MDTDVKDKSDESSQSDAPNIGDPVEGRVWRRQSLTKPSKKSANGPVLRATVKPVKRFRPDSSTGPTPDATPLKVDASISCSNDDKVNSENGKQQRTEALINTPTSMKKKRVREQWSVEDKNHFFDAVAIHGKDFEAIQKAIAQKHRKKGGESVVKTKDQVRHLYYRTWTTVSKLLDGEVSSISSASNKTNQELFAVINYGELRKKLGGYALKKKGIMKLNELVNSGFTSVRLKGKNYRIKTPTCKALKQIGSKSDTAKKSCYSEARRVKLPLRVNLELQPYSMKAWNKVHMLAHNPRTRFSIPLNCQLSYIIKYLVNKWRSLGDKMFALSNEADGSNAPINASNDKLQIYTPPEVNIKAHVKVHQILLNKNHCIVSYTSLKSSAGNKNEDPTFARTDLDSLPLDLSSEDESENVAANPASDFCEDQMSSIDHEDVCHDLVDNSIQEVNTSVSNVDSGVLDQDIEMVLDALDTSICGDVLLENTLDCGVCVLCDSEKCSCMDGVQTLDTGLSTKTSETTQKSQVKFLETALRTNTSETTQETQVKTVNTALRTNTSETTQETQVKNSENVAELCLNSLNCIEREIQVSSKDKEVVNTTALAGNDSGTAIHSSRTRQECIWNEDNTEGVTIAEIYLMLGKPTSFKLCYDWIQSSTKNEGVKQKISPNSALNALIQTAAIIKTKLSGKHYEENTAEDGGRAGSSTKQSKTVEVGVQCSSQDEQMLSPPTIKKYGRGLSKLSTASTSFAVPQLPYYHRKSTSSQFRGPNSVMYQTPVELDQNGQIRGHRNELFKHPMHDLSNNRRAVGVRKMKKFSVVSGGNKKVGFIPTVQPVANNPEKPAVEAQSEKSLPQPHSQAIVVQMLKLRTVKDCLTLVVLKSVQK
uniref:protein cramped-like isoform X3 n=1 Tax=Ciona intestinalis TaxID=7719 RepID=UPI000180CEE3|nr:protein cramped-like isoform X3 [Ciona intestinalis]|eukprot:XP_026693287.1 protein cramped-like isoform X3 [Ciona intestinalis]